MRKFIIKTVCFSLPLLIIAIIMEILLRNIPNDYLLKKQYLDNYASEIETLILGSSHSLYGLNPEFFSSNTFNASHSSQSLDYDYKIFKKYQSEFKNLKTIVLPISYFSLYFKLETGVEPWRVKNYTLYYDINSHNIVSYSEILSHKLSKNVKRLLSYFIFGNSAISCTNLGWSMNYNSKKAQDLLETGKTAAKRHINYINSDKNQQIFQENILILESIMQWSNKNNVKILFLTPPAFETYCQNLNLEQLNVTIKTITGICSNYNNCIYFNLLSDPNFVSEDFYDADHLSEIGAEKLSKIINKKILEWK